MDEKSKTIREIILFLVLTTFLSTLAYIPIIQGVTISGGQSKSTGLLMLAPGLAAIITYLVFEHSLRPIGWKLGKITYLLIGLVIPFIYCIFEYGYVWLTGQGRFNGQFPPIFPIFLVTLLFNGTLSALLEEVGWRGFLVPKMIKLSGFTRTAVVTGLIWAVWHYPLIIFTNVGSDNTPLQISLACFTIFVVGLSFPAAWLRLESGSIWPPALLHSSQNVFMLYVFNVLTTDSGNTLRLLGEQGALTAAVGLILAILFWRIGVRNTATSKTGAKKDLLDTSPISATSEEGIHVA
jgi:CAAX protease family protein